MQPPLPVTIHATYMFAAYLTGRRVCVYHGERLAVRIDIDSHCQSDAASQQSVAAAARESGDGTPWIPRSAFRAATGVRRCSRAAAETTVRPAGYDHHGLAPPLARTLVE